MPDSSDLPFIIDSWGLIGIKTDGSNLYIIDTGTTHSVLFRDRIDVAFQTRGMSLLNGKRPVPLGRVDSLNLGGLIVRNNRFAFMSSRRTVFGKMPNVVGVIGMDILAQRHSFFDIENQRLYLSTYPDSTSSPCLTLRYTTKRDIPRDIPFVSLTINGTEFNDILFDSGYNQFIKLNETGLRSIASTTSVVESSFELTDALNNRQIFTTITFDSLNINGLNFNGELPVQSTNSTQLLGSAFMIGWRAFSINPEARTISFYN